MKTKLLVLFLFIACATQALASGKPPPDWLPLSMLNDKPTCSEFRDIKDRIHLYLPDEDKPIRGVFACFVFQSGDPRADLVVGNRHKWAFPKRDGTKPGPCRERFSADKNSG